MANDSTRPPGKPNDPGGLPLAVVLTILAGAVDAVSYLHWHGLFVSFMSGNSTVLGVQVARVQSAAWLSAAVIGGFVAGVTVGELLATSVGRRAAEVVLLLEAGLLAVGAVLIRTGGYEFLTAPMLSLTMGIHNAAVHRGHGISVSLTYVTGTLVHVGRGIAKAIQTQAPWSAVVPYLLLWAGLVVGALIGTLVAGKSETVALALASGAAMVLALLAALSLVGTHTEDAETETSEPVAENPAARNRGISIR